jgi:hypothetical protein
MVLRMLSRMSGAMTADHGGEARMRKRHARHESAAKRRSLHFLLG